MSWTWVIRMLIILIVVLVVVAGTAVALRLTDPGADEVVEVTPTTEAMESEPTPTPLVTPYPTLGSPTPLPIPTPPPAPTSEPEGTPATAIAVGDPCTSDLSAAIIAANESQAAVMRGELDAAQLSATWGEVTARAQASAAYLLGKSTDTYSVNRITAIVLQLNTCIVQSVSEDESEVVVETQEVWTYDAVLNCTASDEEQISQEVVTYPGQQYTFAREGDGWRMQDWSLGVVSIDPAWQCT